jgi:hypothetical protein
LAASSTARDSGFGCAYHNLGGLSTLIRHAASAHFGTFPSFAQTVARLPSGMELSPPRARLIPPVGGPQIFSASGAGANRAAVAIPTVAGATDDRLSGAADAGEDPLAVDRRALPRHGGPYLTASYSPSRRATRGMTLARPHDRFSTGFGERQQYLETLRLFRFHHRQRRPLACLLTMGCGCLRIGLNI